MGLICSRKESSDLKSRPHFLSKHLHMWVPQAHTEAKPSSSQGMHQDLTWLVTSPHVGHHFQISSTPLQLPKFFCPAMALLRQPPLYKLYIGGMWSGYGHDDVRQWLWETTHSTPVSIRLWQRGAEATMQSCFVGYSSANVAQDALAILQHRPYMWGQRVTVIWGRDNPGPPPGQAVPAAHPAAPSDVGMHAGGSFLNFVDKEVDAGSSTLRPTTIDVGVQAGGSFLNFFVDKEVDAGQEVELGSPTEGETVVGSPVAPTEVARSPTRSPSSHTPTSEPPTVVGEVKKETEDAVQRVQVKRELQEAKVEVKKLKKEVKEEEED